MEIWKDIKGYEGLYQVSNLGRVKNKQRENWGFPNVISLAAVMVAFPIKENGLI